MGFLVVGLSHRTTPVEVRERLSVAEADLGGVLASLRAIAGVSEAALVSTCNRTEIYADVEDPERDAARLREFLAYLADLPLADLESYLYVHSEAAAVRHVLRVSASLDSMVVGESQILGQVKAAFAAAQAAEAARGKLGRLMERAFAVAKRVRSETQIGASTLSVSGAAVELARTIFGDLKGLSLLLVGAGKMGRLTLQHLRSAGVQAVYVANRTAERAEAALQASPELLGFPVPLDQAVETMEKVDIVVSSLQMGRYVLDRAGAEPLLKRRRGRPLFLVDIAVPRSLDPEVHRLENVFLYDIDDLQGVVENNLQARKAEATAAERIVETEADGFLKSLRQLDVVPSIKALRDRLEAIRKSELEQHLKGRADLTPETRAAVEAATRAIINKVAHGPIRELRRAVGSPEGKGAIDAIRRALIDECDEPVPGFASPVRRGDEEEP